MLVVGNTRDEIPNTSFTTPLGQGPDDDGALDTFGKGVIKGFMDIAKGVTGTLEAGVEAVTGENEYLSQVTQNIRDAEKPFETKPDGWIEQGASMLGQAVPYIGTMFAGGVFTAGRYIPGALAFMTEGQRAYEEAKSRGAGEGVAEGERLITGTLNAIIMASRVGNMLKLNKAGGNVAETLFKQAKARAYSAMASTSAEFGVDIAKSAINQSIASMIAEGGNIFVPALMEGKKAIPQDANGNPDYVAWSSQIWERELSAGLVGGIMGVAMPVATAPIMWGLKAAAAPKPEQIKAMRDYIINSKELDVLQKADALNQLPELPGAAPLSKELQQMTDLQKRLQAKCIELNKEVRPASTEQIAEGRATRALKMRNALSELEARDDLTPEDKVKIVKSLAKGPLVAQFKPLSQDGFTEAEGSEILRQLNNSPLYKGQEYSWASATEGLDKMFKQGVLPEPNELRDLEPIIGATGVTALLGARQKTKSLGARVFWGTVNTLNFPKALLASSDMSGMARQGWQVLFMSPKEWTKGLVASYRAWLSPEYRDFHALQIKTNPLFRRLQQAGLTYTEVGRASGSEEPFGYTFSRKIPGIEASEAAYTTGLNHLRWGTALKVMEKWVGKGMATQDNVRILAKCLNHATGRGDLHGLESLASFFNITFFSPRQLISLPQRFADIFPHIGKKGVEWSPARRMMFGSLVAQFGIGSGVLMLLANLKKSDPKKYKDMEIEADPRSSDFGKIRIGNTRVDYWAGESQLFRLVAQLATGQRKATTTKEIMSDDRRDILWRFIQSKLSPATGTMLDMYRGEDWQGNIIEGTTEGVLDQIKEHTIPLGVQDIIDAARFQGLSTAAWTAPMAFHGVGVMTYEPTEASKAATYRNSLATEYFGTAWNQLGPMSQKALRAEYPAIDQLESQAHNERLTRNASAKYAKEQRDTERYFFRSLPIETRRVMEDSGVEIGGVSRRVGEDWVLNDARYKVYKTQVALTLQKVLPRIAKMNLSPTYTKIMMEEMIDTVKKYVRQQLIQDATVEDLARREQ
jgi:hypothetical protein